MEVGHFSDPIRSMLVVVLPVELLASSPINKSLLPSKRLGSVVFI